MPDRGKRGTDSPALAITTRSVPLRTSSDEETLTLTARHPIYSLHVRNNSAHFRAHEDELARPDEGP